MWNCDWNLGYLTALYQLLYFTGNYELERIWNETVVIVLR
jgi:hypothetical protein